MDWVNSLIDLVKQDKLASIILLLILMFLTILAYKNFRPLQKIYNWITNIIPWIKKEYIVIANFSKKSGNINDIIGKYSEAGCKVYRLETNKQFTKEGAISKTNLEKVINEQQKVIKEAKARMKKKNSFIYIGFPHVPFGFLDGVNFTDIDDPVLYEYQGEDSKCLGKGFFQLKQIYNSSLGLVDNISQFSNLEKEIALKIEQSFHINDNEIKKAVNINSVVSFGLQKPERWGITNYAQVDLYQKAFEAILSKLKDMGVEKIHLFASTPASLSFSLGRVIKHYHPEIIVYNYNNGKFDWGINLRSQTISYYNE